ncbi:hypothetical protein D5I55_05690 [Chakrabartia godavariana]|nr:hypothetical protein D5I55_05690 [Chakrabartia godavariana]
MVRLRSEESTHLRLVSEQLGRAESADEMKHFVMGMIAVAMVLCVVIGSVLLSDVLRIIAAMVCDTFELPTLVSFH